MTSKRNDILYNVIFWLAYFIYEWLANAAVENEYRRYFINSLVIVPITWLSAIFTVHILFKKFFNKNKKIFWTGLILSIFIFSIARRAFNYYYTYPIYYPEGVLTMPFLFPPKLIIEAVSNYLIVGLYAVFYMSRAYYEEQRLSQALKQEKIEAELQLLKSQIHPHFIFNTLNNIYSYAVHKNSRTPDLIHRLSSFLSYNLYDSKLTSIPLVKELEYVHSYIELEKLRYGDRLDIAVNIFHSIEGFYISPLLLLPLVENSFKHGFSAIALDQCWLRIDISRHKEWLTIKIENSVNAEEKVLKNKNGIGLENVKRRLNILYPESREFKYVNDMNTFFIMLRIKNLITES